MSWKKGAVDFCLTFYYWAPFFHKKLCREALQLLERELKSVFIIYRHAFFRKIVQLHCCFLANSKGLLNTASNSTVSEFFFTQNATVAVASKKLKWKAKSSVIYAKVPAEDSRSSFKLFIKTSKTTKWAVFVRKQAGANLFWKHDATSKVWTWIFITIN